MEYVMIKRPRVLPGVHDVRDERRSEKRRKLSLPLSNAERPGAVVDLSTTGAALTGAPAKIDSEIRVEFALPHTQELISVKARVVWSSSIRPADGRGQECGVGVEFVSLLHSDHEKLKDFLE